MRMFLELPLSINILLKRQFPIVRDINKLSWCGSAKSAASASSKDMGNQSDFAFLLVAIGFSIELSFAWRFAAEYVRPHTSNLQI